MNNVITTNNVTEQSGPYSLDLRREEVVDTLSNQYFQQKLIYMIKILSQIL